MLSVRKFMYVFISFVIILADIFLIIFGSLLIDGKVFLHKNGTFRYEDLFSINSEFTDLGDVVELYTYDDNFDKQIYKVKDFLSQVKFEAVSPVLAEIILLTYNTENEICWLTVKEYFKEHDSNIYAARDILNNEGFICEGTIFRYRNEYYLFATIKDDSYVYYDGLIDSASDSCREYNNKTISLFKLQGIDEEAVNKYFSYEWVPGMHIYPNWFSYLEVHLWLEILLIILFVLQFPVGFTVYEMVLAKIKSKNKA